MTRQRRAGQGLRHSCSLRCATVRGRVTRVLWHCTRGRVWHLTTARDRALVLPSTSSHSTTARRQHSAIGTAALHCPQSPDGSGIREHCCKCDVRIGWVFSSTTSSAASLSPRSMPSVQVQTVVLFKSIIRRTSSSGAVAPAVSQPIPTRLGFHGLTRSTSPPRQWHCRQIKPAAEEAPDGFTNGTVVMRSFAHGRPADVATVQHASSAAERYAHTVKHPCFLTQPSGAAPHDGSRISLVTFNAPLLSVYCLSSQDWRCTRRWGSRRPLSERRTRHTPSLTLGGGEARVRPGRNNRRASVPTI